MTIPCSIGKVKEYTIILEALLKRKVDILSVQFSPLSLLLLEVMWGPGASPWLKRIRLLYEEGGADN